MADDEGSATAPKRHKGSQDATTAKKTVDWSKTPSFPPPEGSCSVWIPRKQRYCSHHATHGSTKCTTHASLDTDAPALAAASRDESKPEITVASRKTNLDRPLKRMLNPFSIPALKAAPAWDQLYDDPTRPLCIDIGCSKGLYIRDFRDKHQTAAWNYLGVEIFEPYVVAANAAEAQRDHRPRNLAYVHANINNSLETLVAGQVIARVSLLFPDPWGCGQSKEHKNNKRRVMSAAFAERLAAVMPPASEFYLASDYEDLALDIRQHLLSTGAFSVPTEGSYVPTMTAPAIRDHFKPNQTKDNLIDASKGVGKASTASDDSLLWLASMPLGVPTERDVICENQWRPVYRLVLHRSQPAETKET
ncbi:hypothetical protein LEN26_013494 [Aphanomyces euteiches]|nr:hypothetical protein LEN26_013494 [Aphanomyces euteiches]KAH9125283.1 hypothetical protein AeMF1_004078 [Aphanomyces euteiches]KAH9192749.1 hypothetical protein AeNC1_005269 [Aphanomyces euteiches]